MKNVSCPYCDCDISLVAVEAEDGCCPECGAAVGAAVLFSDDDAYDEFDGEFNTDSTKIFHDKYDKF